MRGHGSLQQLLGKRLGKNQNTKPSDAAKEPPDKRAKTVIQSSLRAFLVPSAASISSDGDSPPSALSPGCVHAEPGAPHAADVAAAEGSGDDGGSGGPWLIACRLVGAKHQPAHQLGASGGHVRLAREQHNPVDANAILVQLQPPGGGAVAANLGHLPASFALHLAPLMDAGAADVAVATPPAQLLAAIAERGAAPPLSLRVAVHAGAAPGHAVAAAAAVAACHREGLQQEAGAVLATNVDEMLTEIREHDGHLLIPEEVALLDDFQALALPSRCLFLRLLLRKAGWHRVALLSTPDVPDPAGACAALTAARLATAAPAGRQEAAALLDSLAVAVLRTLGGRLLPGRLPPGAAPKAQLAEHLLANCCLERLTAACDALVGQSVRLTAHAVALFARLQRLHFLQEGHDISRFLVVARRVARYPPYVRSRSQPVFTTREQLLAYEEALGQAAALEQALEDGAHEAALQLCQPAVDAIRAGRHKRLRWDPLASPVPNECVCLQPAQPQPQHGAAVPGAAGAGCGCSHRPLFLARFCSAWVHAGMATVAVSLLEAARRYGEAVELLQQLLGGNCCPGRRGQWWLRLSVDLEHVGQVEAALEMAEAALADSWVRHGDLRALQRRALRLGKPPRRWRRPSWAAAALAEPPERVLHARPVVAGVGMRVRYYGAGDMQVTVEDLALQHYCSADGGGWTGLHTEGGVWSCLFSLLMWDILFSSVEDVFRSAFQTAPMDLGSDAFYPARREAIEARLQDIALGGAGVALERTWAARHGTFCRGINWERFTLQQLTEIAECVGGVGLSVIVRLLAEDYAGASGGMPDLTLWRPADRACKLVEVKSQRDRLSDQQRAWISAIAVADISVEVCKVLPPP